MRLAKLGKKQIVEQKEYIGEEEEEKYIGEEEEEKYIGEEEGKVGSGKRLEKVGGRRDDLTLTSTFLLSKVLAAAMTNRGQTNQLEVEEQRSK